MGGCMGTGRRARSRDSSGRTSSGSRSGNGQIGKNKPLRTERPKWKSDIALTEGQLRSKRDEFWDTAPAFEGRKEIWDALKAAAAALETGDHSLAQAIVDGASITLPTGTLLDCYDELGARYQLPVYVLSAPLNMIADKSDSSQAMDAGGDGDHRALGPEHVIKFRLSTGRDIKVSVRAAETVGHVKRRIVNEAELAPETVQRWFCGGKMLTDKLRIQDCNIQKGFIVQVILHIPEPEDCDQH